jgi:uncharacterized phiE125 gp8 family phage protein
VIINLTVPDRYAVTLAEAKTHLRVSDSIDTEEDTLITRAIGAATEYIEKYCNRPLIQRSIRIATESFPTGNEWDIGIGNCAAVLGITYLDQDEVRQTYASSNYRTMFYDDGVRLILKRDKVWPTDAIKTSDSIFVDLIAGYPSEQSPADRDLVPDGLKAAMMMMIADMYENREWVITGTIVAVHPRVEQALHFYKLGVW